MGEEASILHLCFQTIGLAMMENDLYTEFRNEHRVIRDLLLAVRQAFQENDTGKAFRLLLEVDALLGPHFRYEEEALYPAMSSVVEPPHVVHQMVESHDEAIASISKLMKLAGNEHVTPEEKGTAGRLVYKLLPDVSECDGLSLLLETLPREVVRKIQENRESAFEEGLGLFQWAVSLREWNRISVDKQ